MSVGKRLFEERKRLDMNQETFGKAGGVAKGAQINYEKDARIPDASYLQGVAGIGVDVQYVLTGERRAGPLESEREIAALSQAIETVIKRGTYDPLDEPADFSHSVQEHLKAYQAQAAAKGGVPLGKPLTAAELKLLDNYNACAAQGKRSIERIAALEALRATRAETAPPRLAEEPSSSGRSRVSIKGDGNVVGSNNRTRTK